MITVRVLLAMLIGTLVMSACGTDECNFPSEDEILATGDSETVQVMVNQGHIEQVRAAGWLYSVYLWEMRGSAQQKPWKHPKVNLLDGTYSGTVTAMEGVDLKLTGVAEGRFLLKPVGCY